MKKGIVLMISLAVLATCAWLLGPRFLVAYHGWEAQRALSEGRTERAVELLLLRLDRDPGNEELRLQIVDLYLEMGNYSRAEYFLGTGLMRDPGSYALCTRLCAVFVEQDKLADAVALLDGLTDSGLRARIEEERPKPPVYDPAPGTYRHNLTVSVLADPEDACYVSPNGQVPNMEDGVNQTPFVMPEGESTLRAVAVGKNGLVSAWGDARYTLEDVLTPVVFEDSAVEALLRELIGKPSGLVVSRDLWGIESLVSEDPQPYRTLRDLRFLKDLTELSLTGTGESADLSGLGELTGLKSLTLRGLGVDALALEHIAPLTALEELDLSQNYLASLTPLSGLTALRTLVLSENSLTDITPLGGLTELRSLDLSQNAVQDISPLKALTAMERLTLFENRIPALQGVEDMRALVSLDVRHNQLKGLTGLEGLPALEELDISQNPDLPQDDLQDALVSLGGLSSLTTLRAANCSFVKVDALTGLQNLRTLDLSANQLESLAGCEGLISLTEANFNKNKLASLMPLKELPALRTLMVENNNLESLAAVSGCPSLKTVYAFGNKITDGLGGITVYRD